MDAAKYIGLTAFYSRKHSQNSPKNLNEPENGEWVKITNASIRHTVLFFQLDGFEKSKDGEKAQWFYHGSLKIDYTFANSVLDAIKKCIDKEFEIEKDFPDNN